MDNNTAYKTQAIDINLLSVLDIAKDGKVVSAEKWVELWNLVFQHINKIDAFCVDMQSTLDNWHESEIALNEIVEDMQMKYAALSTGFIHYGENTPENPHIMLWVRRMNDISTHCFLTNEDVDSELSDTSTNPVQNKVANAALNNKMDKNNPTGTGSFSLNRKSDTVIGNYSFAEGSNGQATGTASHTEGIYTNALGSASHAEGYYTSASGDYSHAEGYYTSASGSLGTHAEGQLAKALGPGSHAEGYSTEAQGKISHAEGNNTKASSDYQHVQGKYNIPDSNNIYVDIVGNGSSDTERSNAYTLDWNGNAWYAGDVYVGSTSGTNKDEGSKKLATEEYVDTQITEKTDQTYDPASANAQSGIAVAEAIAAQPKQIPEITSLTLSDETPSGVYILKKNSSITYVPQYTEDGISFIPFSNINVSSDTLINISKIPTLGAEKRLGIRVMLLSELTEFDSVVPIKRTLGYIEYWKSPSIGYPATGTITYYNYATTDYVDTKIDQTYSPTSANAQSGIAVAEAVSSKADKLPELTELILGDDTPTGYFILKKGAIQNYVEKYYSNGSTQNAKYPMICGTDTLIHIYRTQVSEDGSYEIYVKYLGGYDKYVKKATSDSGLTHTGTMTLISYASQVSVEEAVTEAKGYTDTKIGSIDTALDSIIVLQNSYIGGNA